MLMCVCEFGWRPEEDAVSLHRIPLRQGLSPNLELGWQSGSLTSSCSCLLQPWSYIGGLTTFCAGAGFKLRSSCFCNKCSYPPSHLPSLSFLIFVIGLACVYEAPGSPAFVYGDEIFPVLTVLTRISERTCLEDFGVPHFLFKRRHTWLAGSIVSAYSFLATGSLGLCRLTATPFFPAACNHALPPPGQPRRLLLLNPPLSQSAYTIFPLSPSTPLPL